MLMWTAIYGCATRPTEVPHVRTPVRADPSRPFHLENDYPPESKLLHEEGVCKVKMTVTADDSVRDIRLTQSTGYPRLDQACLIAFVGGGSFQRLRMENRLQQRWRYRLLGNWPRPTEVAMKCAPPDSCHRCTAGWGRDPRFRGREAAPIDLGVNVVFAKD